MRARTTPKILAAALAAAATGAAEPAAADAPAPIALTANGNAAGGLSFTPRQVTAVVGQELVWTNTDAIAPHTVTEDHRLFDLVGDDVNGTPVSASGFGPRTTVALTAFAGTTGYYCRVHPGQMRGTIAVPVVTTLGPAYRAPSTPARTKAGRARRAAAKKAFQRRLTLTWAAAEPADGVAYDVEVKRGSGPWKPLLTRTTDTTITIRAGRAGTTSKVRARQRLADDQTQATGWSPEAVVRP